jgi:hypothetical protein
VSAIVRDPKPADGQYRPVERSVLVELGPLELAERIDWPR